MVDVWVSEFGWLDCAFIFSDISDAEFLIMDESQPNTRANRKKNENMPLCMPLFDPFCIGIVLLIPLTIPGCLRWFPGRAKVIA